MDVRESLPVTTTDEWQLTAVGGLDLSALIILSLGVIAAVAWTWRSLDPVHPLKRRLLLTGLRALALLTALTLLLQPAVHFRKLQAVPAELAVLVDASGSMSLYGVSSRLNKVRQIVEEAESELDALSAKHDLSWYRFAEDLVSTTTPSKVFEPLERGAKSDIQSALTKLNEERGDTLLNGVVLISDGADTEATPPKDGVWDASWAKTIGVPVNTVFIGGVVDRKDLAIEKAEVNAFAFSRTETTIAVTLRSIGLPDREVEAFLWQDGSVLQRRKVQLVGGESRFSFTVFPSALGQQVLTVTVPPPAGDEVPANNRAHVTFEVVRDKFRILHLAGKPSWDQRFLRETLKAWPRIDLVSFYILRTAHQSSTLGSAGMALIPFPTADLFEGHLDEFDVVIFHNFEPVSVRVDRYLDRLAKFVREGGALAVIGGETGFAASKLPSKAFQEILPVSLLGPNTPASRLSDANSFRPNVTEVGASHPLMQLKSSPEENREQWRALGRLDGIGRVASMVDGAFRLAEHPFVTADDGPAPVIAVKDAGKGRTLVIATDSLWRWRFTGPMGGDSVDVYNTFWHQAIAWLTHAPQLDRLRLEVSPSPAQMDAPAQFAVELLDEAYRPMPGKVISGAVSWIRDDGTAEREEFEALLDDQGHYRREWTPRFAGPHRLDVTSADGQSSTRRFLVETGRQELSHLEPQRQLLEAIAKETGGHFESGTMTPGSWNAGGGAARQVLSHTEVSLWDHPLAILFLIGFLTAEWLVRRRLGLR